MDKIFFYFFVVISCFAVSESVVFASIIVEDATIIWDESLEAPSELIEASGKVESRILIEYATVIHKGSLNKPSGLDDASVKVTSRIVVEYATATYHDGLEKPTELIGESEKVSPRIVVVYAPAVLKENLLYPFDPIPGDFSRNGLVDLGDVIRILKMLCGDTTYTVYKEAEVSGDGKVGTEEAIHILREIANK